MEENDLCLELGAPADVFHCPILTVQERKCTLPGKGLSKNVVTFLCGEWVNLVPVTKDGEILLVEQMRFGTQNVTMETPGGGMDRDELDSMRAAARELEEETGCTAERFISLGAFPVNPALENNSIHYYLAFGVTPLEVPRSANDPFERVRVHRIPWRQALSMARSGEIAHALCVLALLLAEPHLENMFESSH